MMVRVFQKYGIFLIVPGIVFLYSIFLKLATGPYWLAPNSDPAYQYLINGLYLIKGIVPNHTDHPGTPLQIMIAMICWVSNIGRPAEDVVMRVLMAPEFYLRMAFIVLSLLTFGTSVILASYVFRKTNDQWAAVLTQLPALSFLFLKSWETFEPVLPVVANVSPEPLLISVLNLFNIFFLMNFFAKTAGEEMISTLGWGFVGGLGVAVKLTFLPLLVIPFIVLSWRNKIIFTGVLAASFLGWTLPIMSKYPIIWGWISGIAMHRGSLGSGGGTLQDMGTYLLYWKSIIIQQRVFAGVFLIASIFLSRRSFSKSWDRASFFLLAGMIGVVVQFSAVTQHPGAHYLLPGLGLFSALLMLLYWQVSQSYFFRGAVLVFILIFVFWGVWQANAYRVRLQGLTQDIVTFHDNVAERYPNCQVIDYYRSSTPTSALFFGDGWNLSPHLGPELFTLYPQKFYFHLWGNQILSFNGRVWANDLLGQGPCVIFQGTDDFDFKDGPYNTRLIQQGRFERTYALIGTTEKQAALSLEGAVHFIQAGDYNKALAWALQARQFHYQPDSTVESLIQWCEHFLKAN